MALSVQEFDLYASNVRHEIKELGDISFMKKTVSEHAIEEYWHMREYEKAFYLIACIDYLCRINTLKLYENEIFTHIRKQKLVNTIYPPDVYIIEGISPEMNPKTDSEKKSIPEFIAHGIVEVNIRDVA